MRIEADGRVLEGRAVRLDGVDPERVHRAVHGASERVEVDCPVPGLVHERVGVVREGMDLWLRGALAAAARSAGERAPASVREALRAARAQVADHDASAPDLAAARRRLAAAGDAEERLRERVATLRGRLRAFEDVGDEAGRAETAEQLADATRELTEVETERIAAEQRLDRLETVARDERDVRERRLELEDRVANLERERRRQLAGVVYDRFRAAVAALPGDADAGDRPGGYEGPDVLAACAVLRVATVEAPVVVATDRLGDADRTEERLDAPVVRVHP